MFPYELNTVVIRQQRAELERSLALVAMLPARPTSPRRRRRWLTGIPLARFPLTRFPRLRAAPSPSDLRKPNPESIP